MTETDARLQSAMRWSDDLEAQFRILNETGLFARHAQDANTIVQLIFHAREALQRKDADQAFRELATGELALQSCVYKESWWWRCGHMHQLLLFAYHAVAILFFLNIATGWLTRFAPAVLWRTEIGVPMAAMVAGGLGASLRGMWFLWLQVSKRIFRTQFVLAHLAAPWVGVLFGIFVFLLIKAALLTVTNQTAADSGNLALPLALCFLAGYSWEWILGRIEQIRTALAASSAKNAAPAAVTSAGGGGGGAATTTTPSAARGQLPRSVTPPASTAKPLLTDHTEADQPDPLAHLAG